LLLGLAISSPTGCIGQLVIQSDGASDVLSETRGGENANRKEDNRSAIYRWPFLR
jgi:hypothetical protein